MESSDDPDADTANFLPQILLIVLLTAVNAFFAAAELAVVSANKNKIRRLASEGNKQARNVEKLASDETKFLSTIQVGITLAGFFSSATASVAMSEHLGKKLLSLGIPYGDTISVVLITLVLSYITLIFGELIPKRIALKNPETTSMKFSGILLAVKFIATPFVKLLSGSCNLLVKMLGIDDGEDNDKISDEDIVDVVTEGVNDGSIGEDKQKIIESTLKFYHLDGSNLMTPRVDVFMIDIDDDTDRNIEAMLNKKFTRVPVYQNSIDNIIGVINVKDLLIYAHNNSFESVNLNKIMRPAFFASEYINANELFKEMKAGNHQMAFLFDEFGGFSGIVTMEDLIEKIVGDINDEYDDEEDKAADIVQIAENTYIVNGSVTIQDINSELDTELDEKNPEYDTIAGLVMYITGKIPTSGESIDVKTDNIEMSVTDISDHRINKIRIKVIPKEIDIDN